MAAQIQDELFLALMKIDRPGSFCTSGSVPAVLAGLEVDGLGPIGLPLTAGQAEELKKQCEQAPYGKGEQTLVDTSVRRVWRLSPKQFQLTNPEWEPFLAEIVKSAQKGLGLDGQPMKSHLYDLLLYEPGSFFLPHRDGEKLERMVATLIVLLPSSFQGGELVVRHEGEEETVDFAAAANSRFRIHYAAFYADCEHEILPLREGYRLCLVYNLTLAKSKGAIAAPRSGGHIAEVSRILRKWDADEAETLALLLEHQYTKDGLVWDALKGVDRVKARVLLEAARQADCHVSLGLLTLHESGSAEYVDTGRRGRGRSSSDKEEYEMGEIFDSDITVERLTDAGGNRLFDGEMVIDEEDILNVEDLEDVDPEEEFEGYTGNAGMTLEHWYRHAALLIWQNEWHLAILCDSGARHVVPALQTLVTRWLGADGKEAAALKSQCLEMAAAILKDWEQSHYYGDSSDQAPTGDLFAPLAQLEDIELMKTYITGPLAMDETVDPGVLLAAACEKHGWGTFREALQTAFTATTAQTLQRNARLLESLCLANSQATEEWSELCVSLANAIISAMEGIDSTKSSDNYWSAKTNRGEVLAGLARSLITTGQSELLSRVVDHALSLPKRYGLSKSHMAALSALQPWLTEHLKEPSSVVAHWVASCRKLLESRLTKSPRAPADFRREASHSCKCEDCAELRKFLNDPFEQVHRFKMKQDRRDHLESTIREHRLDLDCTTIRGGTPLTLVCTKTTKSYSEKVKDHERNKALLAQLEIIEASLPR